jgi:hypothetical protein
MIMKRVQSRAAPKMGIDDEFEVPGKLLTKMELRNLERRTPPQGIVQA